MLKPRKINLQQFEDPGHTLGIVEASKHLRFNVKRNYFLRSADGEITRGSHSHTKLWQFMVCLSGNVKCRFEGAAGKFEFALTPLDTGILVPPGYWREITLSRNSVLSVLASEEYDENDYIRNYDEFLEQTNFNREASKDVPFVALDRCTDFLRFELETVFTNELVNNQFVMGESVSAFEVAFADYCQVRHAVGCGNGLDALVLALKAAGVGAGDEVIVPANSFIASALAITQVGAIPVFVDCLASDYTISAVQVEASITSKTKAIVPVHLYGIPADMDPIMHLADKHALIVIEDAAQAHGALYKGRRVGSIGHFGAFSFYPTKNLGALGDGGAVVCNSDVYSERLELLRNYGSKQKYSHEIVGQNSRLDTLQAAVLKLKLNYIDDWNAKRRELADIYFRKLSVYSESIVLPQVRTEKESVWHLFPVFLNGVDREELARYLSENGISTSVHYPYVIPNTKAYSLKELHPNAQAAADNILSLPMDPFLTASEIEHVCEVISAFLDVKCDRSYGVELSSSE